MDARKRIEEEETSLLQLLNRPAKDNFLASCPNPHVLQRCEAQPRLDRYNVVVPSMRRPEMYDSRNLAEGRALQLGCTGSHEHGDLYMPCSTHTELEGSK